MKSYRTRSAAIWSMTMMQRSNLGKWCINQTRSGEPLQMRVCFPTDENTVNKPLVRDLPVRQTIPRTSYGTKLRLQYGSGRSMEQWSAHLLHERCKSCYLKRHSTLQNQYHRVLMRRYTHLYFGASCKTSLAPTIRWNIAPRKVDIRQTWQSTNAYATGRS